MASSSGGVSADVHTSRASYHRTGSSTRELDRTRSGTGVPAEHLHTIQSGIQADWDNLPRIQTSWINRNDSIKAHYAGSVASVPFRKKFKRGIGLYDSRKADVWRAAAVELVATAGLTFLSITSYQQGRNASVGAFALVQALIYSLAILAAAPISGGHLNPAITLTTFLTGQATFVRSLLYIVSQILGGILGSVAIRFLTSQEARTQYSMGGCLLQALPIPDAAMAGSTTLGRKQGLLAETIFTVVMLFVVYGIGFDTRSLAVTFPIISPFIIGGVFGILIFISQGVGYTAAMNPARCVGPAVIYWRNLWDPLYVFTLGPISAAVVVGIFQHLVMHRRTDAECGPVLPMNFVQPITPDHQRPGFGPRGAPLFYPHFQEQEVAHSQLLVATPGTTSCELQPPSEPNSASKYSLVLQIKAFMQPKGSESRRASTANVVDGPRFDQNLILQQYSNSYNSSDGMVLHSGDPEKDR